ncbi:MAG: FAD:protein FMN transferase [Helcococcus sp.]|nr:FAD:protein FMN transferase [Helcococcus sp.]
MKKYIGILALLLILVGCSKDKEKYTSTFYDTFDTQILYVEYSNSEKNFNKNAEFVKSEFVRLHKLYDNYRTYDGVNNVKTINLSAGKQAVKVDEDLFNMIKFSLDNYDKVLGKTNVAMGKVLDIWHNIRKENEGKDDKEIVLPKSEDLIEANKYTDIKKIILDEENKTVYITDPNMSIDFGAVAKGYAVEIVAKELEEKGIENASINAGGNVRTIGNPGDGRKTWGVALQNPDVESSDYLDVLYIEGSKSIVTSGDYQRYFTKEGKKYHHIIDPSTLWPSETYAAVVVVTKDSGLADLLSTALYLSTKDEAEQIISNYDDEIGIIWADHDGNKTFTDNMKDLMQSQGSTSR